MNRKAQLGVAGLMAVFLILMVMSSLMPTIASSSVNVSANVTNPAHAAVYEIIPLFLITGFLIFIISYAQSR